MITCPAGHDSESEDYCDTCGMPIEPGAVRSAPAGAPAPAGTQTAPPVADPVVCPNCATENVTDALFCEACGYDFTTGTMPRPMVNPFATLPGDPEDRPTPAHPVSAPDPETDRTDDGPTPARPDQPAPLVPPEPQPTAVLEPVDGSAADDDTAPQPEQEPEPKREPESEPEPEPEAGSGPVEPATDDSPPTPAAEATRPPLPETPPLETPPGRMSPTETTTGAGQQTEPFVPGGFDTQTFEAGPAANAAGDAPTAPFEWVAEMWVDPDWYRKQEPPDAMPSPGLPDVIPLRRRSVLIGRPSRSRNITPDIDCESDPGASRRQAQLTTDGRRWFVEDLDSSNGTYVAGAAEALPDQPLRANSRHELDPDDRIYLGAWTRLVIRRATPEEHEAYG